MIDTNRIERRVALAVVGSTVLITAAFLGVKGILEGGVPGMTDRLPLYLFAAGVVFVSVLYLLESRDRNGTVVLVGSLGLALLAFVLLGLAGEGFARLWATPGELLTSRLLVYFLAAALFCTGFGFWLLYHWREYLTTTGEEPPVDQGST